MRVPKAGSVIPATFKPESRAVGAKALDTVRNGVTLDSG